MSDERVFHGLVGWSNWRGGCEIYEDTEATGEGWPRWLARNAPGKHPSGRLLTDQMKDPEGARVVVVVMPRNATREEAEEIATSLTPTQEGAE